MGIRLKYDATGVVMQNKAQQRFGQQLVLQQQKYANDQKEQMFRLQQQGMQQAFLTNRGNNQNVIEKQREDQRIATNEKIGEKAREIAARTKMQDIDFGVFDAQVKGVTAMANDAMKNPNVSPAIKQRIQKLIIGKGAVNGRDWDAPSKAEYIGKYKEEMDGILGEVQPEDPLHVKANKGLLYRQPNGPYLSPEELAELKRTNPNAELQTWQDGKMLPPPIPVATQPVTAQDYYKQDQQKTGGAMFKKDLASKMSELQGKIDAGEMTLEKGQDLRSVAWQQMQDDYDFTQKALGGGQPSPVGQQAMPSAGVPAASGQAPVAPTAVPGQLPQAGQQVMPPAGVPAVPGQATAPVGQVPAAPAVPGQPAVLPTEQTAAVAAPGQPIIKTVGPGERVNWNDVAVGEQRQFPSGNVYEKGEKGLKRVQMGMQGLEPTYNPGGTSNAPLAGVGAPVEPQPVPPPVLEDPSADAAWQQPPPPLSNPQAVEAALATPDNAPAKSQGRRAVSDPIEPSLNNAGESVNSLQKQKADKKLLLEAGATQAPAADMIGETIKTFKSGTPEQKAVLREKMNSPDSIANLETQAVAGNKDAYEAAKLLNAELTPSDMVADAIVFAKKDGKGAVAKLKKQKEAGKLDDASYSEAIVESSGKTAKQVYENLLKNLPAKKGLGALRIDDRENRNERSTLNAIWGEMGMSSSNPVLRAFEKDPTVEDVIKHAVVKGKMSRKDAENWVYNQLLSRNYAEDMQIEFEAMLSKDRPQDRNKKQDMKRDAWTPNTK